jgi:hypothetical protein
MDHKLFVFTLGYSIHVASKRHKNQPDSVKRQGVKFVKIKRRDWDSKTGIPLDYEHFMGAVTKMVKKSIPTWQDLPEMPQNFGSRTGLRSRLVTAHYN